MPFRGKFSGGIIVLEDHVKLPEGTKVLVEPDKHSHVDPTGIAGIWKDERSAEEIIRDIHKARRSKK